MKISKDTKQRIRPDLWDEEEIDLAGSEEET